MKVANIIENSNGDQYVVSKFPEKEIYDNSVLVVNESEQALFIRDGVITRKFSSGRHVISSANQPGLFTTQKKLLGGKAYSITTVYFIRTTHLTEVKWGTDSPILMFDQKFGFSVGIRANGAYSIRIKDAEKLFIKLLGLDTANLTKQQFSNLFRSPFVLQVKDKISKYMRENELTIMEMCTEYITVGERIKEALKEKFLEYGVELLDFSINNISIPEDDPCYAKINNAYAENSVVGIQGENWDKIAKKEISLKAVEHVDSIDVVNFGGASFGVSTEMHTSGSSAPSTVASETMFCRECGARIPADSKFCPRCGVKTGV